MLKLNNLKLFFVLIIIFPILTSLFFIYKQRLYVYTFIVNPISSEQVEDALTLSSNEILEFKKLAFKDKNEDSFKVKIFDKARLDKVGLEIFSPIARFLQNNKSYRELYIKEKNLNKNEKKNLNKIVNNISLEGAYFLNPKFLDKVKMKFYSNKDESNVLLFNYIDFIILKELEKLDKRGLSLKYSRYLEDIKKSISNDYTKIINHLDRMKFYKAYIESIKISPIYTNILKTKEWNDFSEFEINEVVRIMEKIQQENYTTDELSKLIQDLTRFLDIPTISQNLISYNYFIGDALGQDFDIKKFTYNLTLSKKFRNFENTLIEKQFHINTETLNPKIFGNMIRKNFVKVEKKLNLQEYFSNLLFSLVMAIVFYLVTLNLFKQGA